MFVIQLKAAGSWRSCIWLMTWFRTVRKRVLSSPKTSKASWLMPAHMWPGKLTLTCASCVHQHDFVFSHVCSVCFSAEMEMTGVRSTWRGCWISGRSVTSTVQTSSSSSNWLSRTRTVPNTSPQVRTTQQNNIPFTGSVCLVWHATHTN